jgi:glycerol-3-phosphate cytidylyltransferase
MNSVIKVITYGTFDMLHQGHVNLLRRAKDLGNYLIVGVTSEDYDRSRGKLNVVESTEQRVAAVKALDFVDEVVVETSKFQKLADVTRLNIDRFVIGDDWQGHFDYLKEKCEVIYLPRTVGISSTQLRERIQGTVRLGIIGTGRIAERFVREASHIHAVNVRCSMARTRASVEAFNSKFGIPFGFTDFDELLSSSVDAVYIATPHETHFEYAKAAISAGKHVLCEKPICLSVAELKVLQAMAKEKKVALMEGIKTAFFQAFAKLLRDVKAGKIGEIVEVRSTFTKLMGDRSIREWQPPYGGAFYELASYPLLLATKLLGAPVSSQFLVRREGGVDAHTTIICTHDNNKHSISTVAIGAKSEGFAVITGTKGYVYVPAPWWLTRSYSIRGEDPTTQQLRVFDMEGDGLRYELSEFVSLILRGTLESKALSLNASENILRVFDSWNNVGRQ